MAKSKINYEDFDLRTVKVTKDGVDITHHVAGIDAGTIIKKGEGAPHPDLLEALESLNLYAVERLGLLEGWDFAREHLKDKPELLEMAIEGHRVQVERWKTTGVHWKGNKDNLGIMVTGSLACPKSGSTGLSVPKINYEAPEEVELGYEEDVAQLAEVVRKEVYNYRFKGKRQQLSIPMEEDEDQTED